MRVVDLIEKKRDKNELTQKEISFLLTSYLSGETPDYQLAAFCMAVYFNGMTKAELRAFTEAMTNSGDLISFDGVRRFLVDKHSTGGVGDKTTIALAPILACFNIGTAKLSGRGLGHTGGTVDKFESIPGFRFPEERAAFVNCLNNTGIGIMGYSDSIVPLDKKLYSLRDVTATVPSIPLIASSIMSKKLAVQSDAIVLDVKVGSGSFVRNMEDAKLLAETMCEIGQGFERNVTAVLSNMDQPLGYNIGNSLECLEAFEMLQGAGPADFTELVTTLASIALVKSGEADSMQEAALLVEGAIDTGDAIGHLKDFIKECGGDPRVADDPLRIPLADNISDISAESEGFVQAIDAAQIGRAAMLIGAGRAKKGDVINHGVGITLNKKIGDRVEKGEELATLYYDDDSSLEEAKKIVDAAYRLCNEAVEKLPVIHEIIGL